AGFPQHVIDTEFGHPPFDPKPIVDHFNTSLERTRASASADSQQKPVTNFLDALKAGWGESVVGLLQERPKTTLAHDAPMASRIAGMVGTLAGDFPAMVAGYMVGGGQITGTAGAFALPAGMRRVLMDKYENGEVENFQDFWERASGAFIDTAKGWVTGAATGAAGKIAGLAPIASPTARAAAVGASEIATMVTVGKALEGMVPQPQEFLDAAVTLGFVKGAAKTAGKLRELYATHGVHPKDVLQDIEKDPTIAQDLASHDIEIPRAYQEPATQARQYQRYEELGVAPGTPEKPHGLYVSPAEVTSPHAELGGERAIWELDPDANILHINEQAYPSSDVVIRRDAISAGAGVHAAKVLLGDDTFQRLRAGSKDDAIAFAQEHYPGPDYSKYYDKQEVIEAIGAQEARKQGYDAIEMPDKNKAWGTDFSETVLLNTSKAKSVGGSGGAGGPGEPQKPAGPPPEPERPLTDAEAAILSKIVREDQKSPSMTSRKSYTSIFDNLHPIWGDLKDIGKEKLPTAENAYDLMRLTRGTMGKGTQFLERGAFKFDTYETVTRGYKEIIQPVKKDLARLSAYMVSKRVLEKEAQGIHTGFDLAQATDVVEKGASRFQAIHEELLGYREAYLQYLVDGGIVKKDALPAIREANKDFVPFARLFEEQPGGKPGSSHAVKNPLKRMTGSDRDIHDPILSDIKNTFLFIGLAERNAARQAFVKHPELAIKKPTSVKPIALTDKEIRTIFEKFLTVREEVKRTRTETTTAAGGTAAKPMSKQAEMVVDRVKEALISRGYHPGAADQYINRVVEAKSGKAAAETVIHEVESKTYIPELDARIPAKAATIFRGVTEPVGKDEMVVYEKGERHVYKVDPAVAEAFMDLDRISTNFVADMVLHTPASLLRAGVIVTPEYIFRNIIRDAVASFIFAGGTPLKTIKGGISIIRKDDAFQKWLKGGGANATMVAIDRDYVQSHIMDLNVETGVFQRAWNVARTPIDVLRAASEFVENSTRLGTVRSELQQAKDKATIQALSLIARESTVDFALHGRDLQEFGKMTAFFNPTLQGINRFTRALKENPIATVSKSLAVVTLPALLLWWANRDDEEINDLLRTERDTMLHARIPLPNGDSYILRIPLAHEIGILFATLPARILDAYIKEDPNAFRDLDATLLAAFTPSLVPTLAVPMIAQTANVNTLSDGPLIPSHLEQQLAEYRYTPYTTELSKAIGSRIGAFPGMEDTLLSKHSPAGGVARALATPILLENYVRAWTGGMGMYFLQLADRGLREAGVLPDPVKPAWALADIPFVRAFVARYPSASSQSIQDFYEDTAKSKIIFNTFETLAMDGDEKAEAFMETHKSDMMQLDGWVEALGMHAQLIRKINKNPDQTPEEKRQLIDTLYYRMIELSRAGNSTLREMKVQMKEMAQ
ncbi:MAG: hypothetical protein OEV08_06300, partial [Nitrospira sp.]|nr:hypothetical protein [Nitrospira sp.]